MSSMRGGDCFVDPLGATTPFVLVSEQGICVSECGRSTYSPGNRSGNSLPARPLHHISVVDHNWIQITH